MSIPKNLTQDRYGQPLSGLTQIIKTLDAESLKSLEPATLALADTIRTLQAKNIPTEHIQTLITGMIVTPAWIVAHAEKAPA